MKKISKTSLNNQMKLQNSILDEYLIFNFKFLNKSKIVNDDFLNHIKRISNYSIRELMQSTKKQCGYVTIEAKTTDLPTTLLDELISYLEDKNETNIKKTIEKYDYLRVGGKERLYGILRDNVFLAIIFDPNKKSNKL